MLTGLDQELWLAVSFGDLSKAKDTLKKGADINAKNGDILWTASSKGDLEMVKELIKKGANVNINDSSALKAAAFNGHIDVVKELLYAGANPEAISSSDMAQLKTSYPAIWKLLDDASDITFG